MLGPDPYEHRFQLAWIGRTSTASEKWEQGRQFWYPRAQVLSLPDFLRPSLLKLEDSMLKRLPLKSVPYPLW